MRSGASGGRASRVTRVDKSHSPAATVCQPAARHGWPGVHRLQQLHILEHGDEWASIVIDRARKTLQDLDGQRLRFRHSPGCGIETRPLRSRQGANLHAIATPGISVRIDGGLEVRLPFGT